MPKSKRGPSLVELMRKGSSAGRPVNPQLPAWWRSDAGRIVSRAAPPPRDTADGSMPSPETIPHPDPPLAAVQEDRVVLSFSSFSAGIAVFVILALLCGGFLAGRAVGIKQGRRSGYQTAIRAVRADTADAIASARRAAPNSDIFGGLGSSPVSAAHPADRSKPPPAGRKAPVKASRSGSQRQPPAGSRKPQRPPESPASPKWITGYTYIIVQEFRSEDHADAIEAREFLRAHGVNTTILESRGRYKYRLVADKGFNGDDPNQRKWCDEFHARIQELGRQYVKAGGRYDLQGYQKKLTGAGW